MRRAGSVADAAARYVQAADYGPDVSGVFFASAPKKLTGPVYPVELAHVTDRPSQDAAWSAVVEVAGVGYPSGQPEPGESNGRVPAAIDTIEVG